jgi:hypothetical protein|tara:strand:- start:410 stop:610 length:201 start_codon:yes stop_codon:yes gene_type:complete
MDFNIENWLRESASSIYKEVCDNTVSGQIGLDEFANYTGHDSGEEVLHFMLKRVADHVSHMGKCNE